MMKYEFIENIELQNTIVGKTAHAKEIISNAIKKYGDKLAVACSFGKDSMVVVHLALSVKLDVPIFTVMTSIKPIIEVKNSEIVLTKIEEILCQQIS
ncbi:MAG TPA: phosphoadenosine phosphosulfate reductase family protein [Candidatus Bathyarchaeia archaeon]|nr:phosphoadenosine phosphosulfate reductase family protein [Candidatus Bathyarchaeia archaeon]